MNVTVAFTVTLLLLSHTQTHVRSSTTWSCFSFALSLSLFIRTRNEALFSSRLQAAQIKINKHNNWRIYHQRDGRFLASYRFCRPIAMQSKRKDSREQRTGGLGWLYCHLQDVLCICGIFADTGTRITGKF